jgi:hypothetical protein
LPVLPRPDLAANLPSGRAEGMMEPTAERRQHDRISRDAVQLADSAGLIGNPWHAEGLLARLERHGDIGRRERAAGDEFARLFHLAHLDPLRAADMGQRSDRAPTAAYGGDRARRRINAALDALGGLDSACGSCAWHVIGGEMPMAEWARRQEWSGKPIRPEVAKGVLLGTLGALSRHFGV